MSTTADPTTHFILPACRIDLGRREVRRIGHVLPLTPLEVDLLRYLVERRGRPVSRREIERDVWGIAEVVDSSAVPVAIRRLRTKIEPDPHHPRSLTTVRGFGWCLHTTPDQSHSRSRTAAQVMEAVLAWASGHDDEAATLLREEVDRDDSATDDLLQVLRRTLGSQH